MLSISEVAEVVLEVVMLIAEVVVVVDVEQRHDCGLAQPVGVHLVEEGAQAGEVD